jgi:hypothetical protein
MIRLAMRHDYGRRRKNGVEEGRGAGLGGWCLPPDIEEAELRPDEHLGGYAEEPEPPHLHLEEDLSMSICFRESRI